MNMRVKRRIVIYGTALVLCVLSLTLYISRKLYSINSCSDVESIKYLESLVRYKQRS